MSDELNFNDKEIKDEVNNNENSTNTTSLISNTVKKSEKSSDGKHSSKEVLSKSEFFDWMEIVISAMIAVVLVFTLAFRVATIDGSSMVDTLHNGERVLLSRLFYEPKHGDIVVISRNYNNEPNSIDHDSQPIIKRVIATAGQKISIDFDEGVVYVDGQKLEESYTYEPTKNSLDFPTDGSEVTVPEGCVFVMGDNRNNSLDSRSNSIGNLGNGMVDTRYIIGKAVLRIFPFSNFGGLS